MKRLYLLAAFILLLAVSPLDTAFSQDTSHTSFRFRKGSSLPSTCSTGDVFFRTSNSTYYGCTATNTWSAFTAGGGGTGDFNGPASSTDNAIVRFDGTTGKTGQNSLATIDDNGSINIPTGQSYKVNNVAISGGTTINATDGVIPYRSNSTTFADSPFARVDANTIHQRNSTTPQKFVVLNSFTDISNYNGFSVENNYLGTNNNLGVFAEKVGTSGFSDLNMYVGTKGTGTNLLFVTAETNRMKITDAFIDLFVPLFTSDITLGLDGSGAQNRILFFNNTTTFDTSLEASTSASANVAYILPPAGPSVNGQAMVGTTAGVMSWSTALGFAVGGTGLTTAADDTVMVSSGSAWVAKAIPDCVDTGGNHLNYTASTNSFSCGTSGGSGGSGITIGTTTITGGTDTRSLFNNAGVVGERVVTGTGNVVLSASPTLTGTIGAAAATFSGTIVQTSASASAFESGPNGSTNPVFRLVNNVASSSSGVSIASMASGASAQIVFTAISGGTNTGFKFVTQGDGNSSRGFTINGSGINLFTVNTNIGGTVLFNTTNYGWSSTGDSQGSVDTNISRNAAGVVQFGTTVNNASGSWLATGGTLSGAFIHTGITSDATHTDSAVCQDTTTHQYYSGSGTLGVCLGTSTLRAKNNIASLNLGLNTIMKLKPISFTYKEGFGYNPNKTYYGFGAEDVRPIIPNLAELNKEGQPNSVDILGMVPLLVRAVQEQQVEIEKLKSRIGER